MPDESKEPATIEGSEIAAVFDSIVNDVKARISDDSTVVDVEISFHRLVVKKGIPIFAPKAKQSSLEIRLATRVRRGD